MPADSVGWRDAAGLGRTAEMPLAARAMKNSSLSIMAGVATPPSRFAALGWRPHLWASTTAARSSAATTTWPPTPPAASCWTGGRFTMVHVPGAMSNPSPGDQQPRPDRGCLQRRPATPSPGRRRHPPRASLLDRGPAHCEPRRARCSPTRARRTTSTTTARWWASTKDDAGPAFHGYLWERGRFDHHRRARPAGTTSAADINAAE